MIFARPPAIPSLKCVGDVNPGNSGSVVETDCEALREVGIARLLREARRSGGAGQLAVILWNLSPPLFVKSS